MNTELLLRLINRKITPTKRVIDNYFSLTMEELDLETIKEVVNKNYNLSFAPGISKHRIPSNYMYIMRD